MSERINQHNKRIGIAAGFLLHIACERRQRSDGAKALRRRQHAIEWQHGRVIEAPLQHQRTGAAADHEMAGIVGGGGGLAGVVDAITVGIHEHETAGQIAVKRQPGRDAGGGIGIAREVEGGARIGLYRERVRTGVRGECRRQCVIVDEGEGADGAAVAEKKLLLTLPIPSLKVAVMVAVWPAARCALSDDSMTVGATVSTVMRSPSVAVEPAAFTTVARS